MLVSVFGNMLHAVMLGTFLLPTFLLEQQFMSPHVVIRLRFKTTAWGKMCGGHVSRLKHEELEMFWCGAKLQSWQFSHTSRYGGRLVPPAFGVCLNHCSHLHYQQAVPVRGGCNLPRELRLLAQLIYCVAVLTERLFDMSETSRVCLHTTFSSLMCLNSPH